MSHGSKLSQQNLAQEIHNINHLKNTLQDVLPFLLCSVFPMPHPVSWDYFPKETIRCKTLPEILLFDKSSLTLVSRIHRRKKKKGRIDKKLEDTAKKEICHLEWKLVQKFNT